MSHCEGALPLLLHPVFFFFPLLLFSISCLTAFILHSAPINAVIVVKLTAVKTERAQSNWSLHPDWSESGTQRRRLDHPMRTARQVHTPRSSPGLLPGNAVRWLCTVVCHLLAPPTCSYSANRLYILNRFPRLQGSLTNRKRNCCNNDDKYLLHTLSAGAGVCLCVDTHTHHRKHRVFRFLSTRLFRHRNIHLDWLEFTVTRSTLF